MSEADRILESAAAYNASGGNYISSIIDLVRNGIKFHIFQNIASKSPFSIPEWSKFLHISERTMQRYKKEKRTFDPIHSERILQIAILYKIGSEVFGNKEKFDSWLDSQNISLGNVKPKRLLDSSFGIELLKEELSRIQHGIFA